MYSQNAPQAFNWQSVIKDNTGALLVNTTVGIQFNIKEGTATGRTVYRQSETLTTDANGVIHITIRDATNANVFNTVNWNASNFLEVNVDASGGTTYATLGTFQLLCFTSQ